MLTITFIRPLGLNILVIGPELVRASLGVGEFREPKIVRDIHPGKGRFFLGSREAVAFESIIVMPGQREASGVNNLMNDGFQEHFDRLSLNKIVPDTNAKRRIFGANWSGVACRMYAQVELDVLPTGVIQKVSGASGEAGCL